MDGGSSRDGLCVHCCSVIASQQFRQSFSQLTLWELASPVSAHVKGKVGEMIGVFKDSEAPSRRSKRESFAGDVETRMQVQGGLWRSGLHERYIVWAPEYITNWPAKKVDFDSVAPSRP